MSRVVTGFFIEETKARSALVELLLTGVPRDLIEVVIAKHNENRFFKTLRRRQLRRTAANAGRGALIGLILFSFLSALLIVSAGARESARLTWIMLLGPNMGVMLGGFIGLLWGFIKREPVPAYYHRLLEREAILMVVKAKTELEAESLATRLSDLGALDVRREKS